MDVNPLLPNSGRAEGIQAPTSHAERMPKPHRSITALAEETLQSMKHGLQEVFNHGHQDTVGYKIAYGMLNFVSLACLGLSREEVKKSLEKNPIYQRATEDTTQAKALAIAKALGRGSALVLGSLFCFTSRLIAFAAAAGTSFAMTVIGVWGGGTLLASIGLYKLVATILGAAAGGVSMGLAAGTALTYQVDIVRGFGMVCGAIPAIISSELVEIALGKSERDESTAHRLCRQNCLAAGTAGAVAGLTAGLVCSALLLA
jgi:hypothetical protein